MNFTYKIENYYPHESRLFVVYTPEDSALEPMGGWVIISATMTEAEIQATIIQDAPYSRWETPKSPIAKLLEGTGGRGAKPVPVIQPQAPASPNPSVNNTPTVVTNFALSHSLPENFAYSFTQYNASTKKDISHVYSATDYLIKTNVENTEVLEYYQANVSIEGVPYSWVSRDVVSGTVLDRYTHTVGGLEKIPDVGTSIVRTNFSGYDYIDPRLQPLLSDFTDKGRIFAWSDKATGLIVEYRA